MPLEPGDECLLRYRYPDGTLQAALPMRVVEDSAAALVAWLAPDTPIMYWSLPSGDDPRVLPLERRFQGPLGTGPRHWRGPGVLHVLEPGEPFQVLLFWDRHGQFSHWYVNFEQPASRTGNRIDTVDWHLDLVIDADEQPQWKDADEAVFAVGTSFLSLDALIAAREAGAVILADLKTFLNRNRRWQDFVPPSEWSTPELPKDWAK